LAPRYSWGEQNSTAESTGVQRQHGKGNPGSRTEVRSDCCIMVVARATTNATRYLPVWYPKAGTEGGEWLVSLVMGAV